MSEPTEPINPVTRLRRILKAASSIDPVRATNPVPFRTVWMEVFSIPNEPPDHGAPEVMVALLETRKLFDEVIAMVSNTEALMKKPKLFIEPLISMREVIGSLDHLDQPWAQYVTAINGEAMARLEYIEDMTIGLNVATEFDVDPATIDEINDDVSKLFDTIFKSDIRMDVKRVLLDILKDLEDAIRLYRVHGAKALKDSVAKATGDIIVHKTILDEVEQKQWIAVAELVQKVETIYRGATTAYALYEGITRALPMLGGK